MKSYISVVVATVERGLRVVTFCSIAIAGGIPSMESTSGLLIRPRNCLAYEDRLSEKRRCPSAYNVSKTSEDFPEPEMPVTTTSSSLGISRVRFLRLLTLAPLIEIFSFTSEFCNPILTPKNPQEFFQAQIEACKTTKHSNGFTQQEKRNIDAVITGLDKGSRIHMELIFYEIGNIERKAAEKQQ